MNNGSYFLFALLLAVALVLVLYLVMMFVFKPDVTPLKNLKLEMLEGSPLPPMTSGQKIYGSMLVLFILSMLLPSLFPDALSFLKNNSAVIPVVLIAIVSFIQFNDKPLFSFSEVMQKDFSWPAFWLCTAAILLGGAVTNEKTGITVFLTTSLTPLLNGVSVQLFAIMLVMAAVLLTNLCNSLIIGMVLQPVVLTYCSIAHVDPAPYMTLLIISVLSTAFCTPAANPIAAMVFANREHLQTKNAYKYAAVFVLFELLVLIPAAYIVMR